MLTAPAVLTCAPDPKETEPVPVAELSAYSVTAPPPDETRFAFTAMLR